MRINALLERAWQSGSPRRNLAQILSVQAVLGYRVPHHGVTRGGLFNAEASG